MRSARLALLLAAALASGACFQLSTVLMVKADGSGTIEQRLVFTSAALAQMRGLAALTGGGAQGFDPMSEAQARAAAAALGPGASYVSSSPITTADGQGRDIVYAFTDINQIAVSEEPPMPGGAALPAQGAKASNVTFAMTRKPGGNSLLKIQVPKPPLPGGNAVGGGSGPVSLGQLAGFKQMFAGARLSIVVQPDGQVVRTSSPYADGRRVTLIDVDIDQLLKDDSVLTKLNAVTTLEEAKAILDAVPGVKIVLDPEITIEFAPAK